MRQNELEVVTADESILELAHLMSNRCFDASFEHGGGLIVELRGADVSASSLGETGRTTNQHHPICCGRLKPNITVNFTGVPDKSIISANGYTLVVEGVMSEPINKSKI